MGADGGRTWRGVKSSCKLAAWSSAAVGPAPAAPTLHFTNTSAGAWQCQAQTLSDEHGVKCIVRTCNQAQILCLEGLCGSTSQGDGACGYLVVASRGAEVKFAMQGRKKPGYSWCQHAADRLACFVVRAAMSALERTEICSNYWNCTSEVPAYHNASQQT